MARYYIGLDLGQANDYTALSVLEELNNDNGERSYAIRHLERYRNIPYPQVVDRVIELQQGPVLQGNAELVIDQTGLGRPVSDLFRERGVAHKAVTITGGDQESRTDDGFVFRVPKRALISGLQILSQSGRLKVAEGLELADVFRSELGNFRVKVSIATGHDSYEAWRAGDHDDLVLSVALAVWGASKQPVLPSPGWGSIQPTKSDSPRHWSQMMGNR